LTLLASLRVPYEAAASYLHEPATIVTGMERGNRPEGLRRTLRQGPVKVSGNPAWLDDARVDELRPAKTLQSLPYPDRFTNLPKHDERGREIGRSI
jgi:hypothetical protein